MKLIFDFILTLLLLTVLLCVCFRVGYDVGKDSIRLETNRKIENALRLGMNESNK